MKGAGINVDGTMMRSLGVLLVCMLLSCCASPEPDPAAIEREILAAMDRQVSEWNRGDIEGYMSLYWKSDRLAFQSGNRRIEGWEGLLAMYREHYSGENQGILEFSDVDVTVLNRDAAIVIGRWSVQRPDTVRAGLFTLVLRRFDGAWRITHDHSS